MKIVRFKAGFANQLFQYCFFLQLQEKYGKEEVFADLSFIQSYKMHGGFRLYKEVKEYILTSLPAKNLFRITEESLDGIANNDDNYLYDGYWQDTSFFPKDISPIAKIIEQDSDKPEVAKWLGKIQKKNSVSIHVRRGDYVNHPVHGNIANQCYYQNAIDYVCGTVETPIFFVFSDDIPWAKKNLSFGENEVFYVDDFEDKEWNDLYLMSCCHHHILSNSSFSWWAHYLNRREDTISIFPEYWYNEKKEFEDIELVGNVVRLPNTPSMQNCNPAPFFSILIPAYNKQFEIRRCLSTVLNQTFRDIEVIITDDASSDDTENTIHQYAERDCRVCYLKNKENSSLLYSRMIGMRQAKGQYVLLVDADDYLELDACATLFETLRNQPCDILEFQYVREPSKELGPWENEVPNDVPKTIMNLGYNYSVWKRCYSNKIIQELVKKTSPYYCNMSEDGFFSVTLSILASSYKRIPNILYHYVVGSGMSTDAFRSREQVVAAVTSIQNKAEHLQEFLQTERADLLPLIQGFSQNDLKKVIQLCTSDAISVSKQMELLHCMDEICNTQEMKKRNDYICKVLGEAERYESANIRNKAKILAKLFKKDVVNMSFRKLFGKRM